MSSAVRFENVSRRFGSVRAVDGVTLDIAPGEFFAMLGPSGSGKTTCLRLIAGFEQPDDGDILIFGSSVAGVPPYRRAVNTVFQDYALFPHMTVGEFDNEADRLAATLPDYEPITFRVERLHILYGPFGEPLPWITHSVIPLGGS